jgi:hypothetical protein
MCKMVGMRLTKRLLLAWLMSWAECAAADQQQMQAGQESRRIALAE